VSIIGDLQTMPLPDLLQFMGLGRKTGVLTVECGLRRKRVAFEDGRAVFCSSGDVKEHLGQHLLARTTLTEAQLAEALREQEKTGRRLGEILISRGLLSAKDLETVLARKVADSLYDLFTWQRGAFSFAEGPVPIELQPIRVEMDWQDLVMEGARRMDELARMSEIVPGTHVRFRVCRERFPEGFPRTNGDKRLLELADTGCRVSEMLPRFHTSDFAILERLAQLVSLGVLEVEQDSITPDAADSPQDFVDQCSDLVAAGDLANAFEVLCRGIERHPADPDLAAAHRDVGDRLRTQFEQDHGGLESVPRLAKPLEAITAVALDSKQAFVVSRVNGKWDVRSIAQICPFDEAEVIATLMRLVARGLLAVESPTTAAR